MLNVFFSLVYNVRLQYAVDHFVGLLWRLVLDSRANARAKKDHSAVQILEQDRQRVDYNALTITDQSASKN